MELVYYTELGARIKELSQISSEFTLIPLALLGVVRVLLDLYEKYKRVKKL